MKPAQCMNCGETVHSLLRASFKLSQTSICKSCGKKVKKRGGYAELFGVLIFLIVILNAMNVSQDRLVIGIGAIIFALFMTWWSWRFIPWDVINTDPED